jgi:hypothetical protein
MKDLDLPCICCGWRMVFPAFLTITGWKCPRCGAGYTNLELPTNPPLKTNGGTETR